VSSRPHAAHARRRPHGKARRITHAERTPAKRRQPSKPVPSRNPTSPAPPSATPISFAPPTATSPAPPAPVPTPAPVLVPPPTAGPTPPTGPTLPAGPVISGVTYYVSSSGSDSNSGTSPGQAWRTVARVNSARLAPGDGVLFQGGETFSDAVLMPGSSGAAGTPIVFGSYGQGQATITQGVWFVQHDLAFEDLAFDTTFQGGSAVHGSSSDVILDRVSISLPAGNQALGLYSNGDHWVIENSQISDTGLSGMLLNGDDYLIADNTLTNTGLDTTNGYDNHGIYLDASDATVTGNTITNFGESAVSVRYRNSTVTGNTISGGQIGIDYYQYDTVAGRSTWTGNTISGTTVASLFVCGTQEGCNQPLESFAISGNQLSRASGIYMNLQPTGGTYTVSSNQLD
jgi:putative cofactor-binding repeat protein